MTKLAAERLFGAYRANFGLRATILQYFSVYGNVQRSDMAYENFCGLSVANHPISITGDGKQSRTNTHIDDIAAATILAAERQIEGLTLNICGAQDLSALEVITVLASELGR